MFRVLRRFVAYFTSHIRFKIIGPFAVLTLLVAVTGVYFSTRLVSGSLEERFTRQLIDAASVVADGLAQRERLHVSQVNAIAFTEGINQAILDGDRDKLRTLIFPLVVNNNIDRVDILDSRGMQLLEIHRPPGTGNVEDYVMSEGAQRVDWPAVQKVLSGVVDNQGDKYVFVQTIDGWPMLVSVGPVRRGNEIAGAVLVSSYVQDLLRFLSQASFGEVSLYNLEGRLISTTFPPEETAVTGLITPAEARTMQTLDGESSLRRSFRVAGREYDSLFGLFRARGEPLGLYSVALQTTFIVSSGTNARNQMILIFATALLLVFGIGYLTANAITGQLQHLMENAMAVASGDFTRRTHISSNDEIGSLAQSLDHMTENLASYTSALQRRIDDLIALYESSTAVTIKSGLNLEHITQAVTTSIKGIVHGARQVIIYLPDQHRQWLVPKAATRPTAYFPALRMAAAGNAPPLLSLAKPKLVTPSEIETYTQSRWPVTNGASSMLLVPLVAGQETVGLLLLTLDPVVSPSGLLNPDSERLLGTFANQAAIAIKNAQLFEETQKAYEELRQLDDLKTQFINIAAHELRTPLGAMLGYATYVEKRVPPKLQKSMRFLNSSMLRMRTMVDAMLTIQRLDAGTAFLRLAPVNVRDLLKKVITDYQPLAELEGHRLEVRVPDKLSPVPADAEKIGLVLSNLLSNAIKFTPEGGCIQIAAEDYIKGVLISVSDNGVGITPEDQEHIFERFYQVRAEHLAGHGGMGIGLTIVKHLVELHEGQVWVESEPGKGSTFYFTLPREEPAPPPDEVPQSRNHPQSKPAEAVALVQRP